MSEAPAITGAAPMVPVRDVTASVAFYVGTLGFTCRFKAADASYAIVCRDGAVIHLQRTGDEGALRATATNIAAYLPVSGVDRLYAELQPALAALPAGRVRPPFDQPYGMREFHVKDPDGFLMFFGEAFAK